MKLTINTERISWAFTEKLLALDNSLVGTKDYLGYTYFWSTEYKHYLRDATNIERKRVHKEFLKLGLDVGGESDKHFEIVKRFVSSKY